MTLPVGAIRHLWKQFRRRITADARRTALFDAEWYLSHYQDVARAGADPLRHYVEHGRSEGRLPTPLLLQQVDERGRHAEQASLAQPGRIPDGDLLGLAWDDGIWAALPGPLAAELAASVFKSQALAICYLRSLKPAAHFAPLPREALVNLAVSAFHNVGADAAFATIWSNPASTRASTANAFEAFGSAVANQDRATARLAYWLAYVSDPGEEKAKRVAAKLFKSGDISVGSALLVPAKYSGGSRNLGELSLAAELRRDLVVPPAAAAPRHFGLDVGYVAAASLPVLATGYTVRTHQLLRALTARGVALACYVRPGFPGDRPNVRRPPDMPAHTELDGVPYLHSDIAPISAEATGYIRRASEVLESLMRAEPPRIVHAASNYRNALPALIAAHKLGVPFVYEVRGLWELTAASRAPGWEGTERFRFERSLELRIAAEADHVLSITRGIADELIEGGISAGKITVLPNAVDPGLFQPAARDRALERSLGLPENVPCIVYCGSFVDYEGLDDLISAVALLSQRGSDVRLILVGDGGKSLAERATASGVADRVVFTGAVPADQVHRYWSLADVVALPRKNYRVCQIVSPLKPFEAMAMGKPVVVSDLRALREIVEDGRTGRIVRPEDPPHLADIIEELLADPAQQERLGAAGRDWVLTNRTWDANAERLAELYASIASSETHHL